MTTETADDWLKKVEDRVAGIGPERRRQFFENVIEFQSLLGITCFKI